MADRGEDKRVYTYRGGLPGWLALVLLAPLLLAFFSVVLVLLAGGALAAVVLPILLRRRLREPMPKEDRQTIELDRSQYTRVEPPAQRLPEE